jgi:hypothetical protein
MLPGIRMSVIKAIAGLAAQIDYSDKCALEALRRCPTFPFRLEPSASSTAAISRQTSWSAPQFSVRERKPLRTSFRLRTSRARALFKACL